MPVQSLGLQLVLQQSFAELIPHISTLGQCNVPGEQGLGPKPRGHLCFSWQSGWGALYWCQVVAPEAAVGLTGSLGVLCPTSSSQHPLLQGAAGSGWTYRYSLSARLWEALPGPRSLLAPPAHLNLGATCREWEGAAGEAEDGGGGGRKRMEMEKEGSSPADHWRTEVSAVVVVSCFYFYSLYVFPISKFHLKKKKSPAWNFFHAPFSACVRIARVALTQRGQEPVLVFITSY